jgi:hypothetical protein
LPIVWTTATNWSVTVPLTAVTNLLAVVAYGVTGNPRPEAAGTATVIYRGTTPLRITSLVRNQQNEWILTGTAIPGKNYRLQYKDRLADLAWQEGGTVAAAGSTASFVCPVDSARSRFYRIQLDQR